MEDISEQLHVWTIPLESIQQALLNFLGEGSQNPALLTGKIFDFRVGLGKIKSAHEICWTLMNCMVVAYYFHEYEMAAKWMKEFRPLLHFMEGSYQLSIYTLYQGLILLSLRENDKYNSTTMDIVHGNISELRNWAANSPDTFLNKLCLLEAEMAIFKGDEPQAICQLNKAIIFSKHNNLVQCL